MTPSATQHVIDEADEKQHPNDKAVSADARRPVFEVEHEGAAIKGVLSALYARRVRYGYRGIGRKGQAPELTTAHARCHHRCCVGTISADYRCRGKASGSFRLTHSIWVTQANPGSFRLTHSIWVTQANPGSFKLTHSRNATPAPCSACIAKHPAT
jgi:hypothetical protein